MIPACNSPSFMATRSYLPQGAKPPASGGHERTDARAGWIFAIVLFLLFGAIGIHLIVGRMLVSLRRTPFPGDQYRPAATTRTVSQLRPGLPRLQISPSFDLEAFRAREEAELNSYGWIDKTN